MNSAHDTLLNQIETSPLSDADKKYFTTALVKLNAQESTWLAKLFAEFPNFIQDFYQNFRDKQYAFANHSVAQLDYVYEAEDHLLESLTTKEKA